MLLLCPVSLIEMLGFFFGVSDMSFEVQSYFLNFGLSASLQCG